MSSCLPHPSYRGEKPLQPGKTLPVIFFGISRSRDPSAVGVCFLTQKEGGGRVAPKGMLKRRSWVGVTASAGIGDPGKIGLMFPPGGGNKETRFWFF